MAILWRDKVPVYDENHADNWMTGAEAEALAAADPDHDWRIQLEGPLRGATYQRHGAGEWVLIESNRGFEVEGDEEE